jgi:hypothetical protein
LERGISDADWGAHQRREPASAGAARLPQVAQPVRLLAVGDGLRQPTLDSRPLFRDVQLADLPQYTDGACFPDVAPLAAALRRFLD